jgi:hypothetical protein
MNAQKKFKLALVGTDSLRGKEIKNVLARRKLAAFDIEFYDADVQAEYSRLTQFRKEPKVIYGHVRSEVGQGATFTVKLPLRRTSP